MQNFLFYNPTRVLLGDGRIQETGREIAKLGKRALLVTSRRATIESGLLGKVEDIIRREGIFCTTFTGIEPNPKLDKVVEGAVMCRKNNVDVIVALGGGSVIDSAKAMAFVTLDDGDPWDFFSGERAPVRALPVAALPTVSGTGSEMNKNSVITNTLLGKKVASHFDLSYPAVSIIDPGVQSTLPRHMTACGMADTLAHVLEVYFDGKDTPLQDRLSEGIIQTVFESESLLDRPEDTIKRGNLCWASILALNGVINAGRSNRPLYAHKIEHELGGLQDIIHAEGLTPILPAIMEIKCRENPKKFAILNEHLYGNSKQNERDSGLEAIRRIREKFIQWEMPQRLRDAGVVEAGLDIVASEVAKTIKDDLFTADSVYQLLKSHF